MAAMGGEIRIAALARRRTGGAGSLVTWLGALATALSLVGVASMEFLPGRHLLRFALLAVSIVAVMGLARRRRRPRAGVFLVGEIESLARVLVGGAEVADVLGGRPRALLTGLTAPLARRLRGVPIVDAQGFAQAIANAATRRRDRVVLVPPIAPALERWVRSCAGTAGLPCQRIGSSQPSMSSLRATLAHDPGALLSGTLDANRPDRQGAIGQGSGPEIADEEPSAATLVDHARVLIVGAGSTLGAALACEVLRHHPSALLLADSDEVRLAAVERSAQARAACEVEARFIDPRDAAATTRLLGQLRPSLVVVVPSRSDVALAERHPCETTLENVVGLRHLLDAVLHAGAPRLVYASSLCAAGPASALGATLRFCELLVQSTASRTRAPFLCVRLPALVDAEGGAVTRIVEQVERGWPITLPDPAAARRLAPSLEGARLLLDAAAVGEAGDLLVCEAGDPIRIVDLARRVLARAGLRLGRDLPVQHVGSLSGAPGADGSEPSIGPDETSSPTSDPRLRLVGARPVSGAQLADAFGRIVAAAEDGDGARVRRGLAEIAAQHALPPAANRSTSLSDLRGGGSPPDQVNGQGNGQASSQANGAATSAAAIAGVVAVTLVHHVAGAVIP